MAHPEKRRRGPAGSGTDLAAFFTRLRNTPLAELPRVQLWLGEEHFLKQRGLAILEPRVAEGQMREFSVDRFDGGECHGDAVAEAVQSPGLMSPHKLVILRDAEKTVAASLGMLPTVCAAPPPSATLILLAENLPRGKFWQEFPGETILFHRLHPERDFARLQQIVNGVLLAPFGKRIDADALRALIGLLGSPSLSDLRPHLEKLALHAGESREPIREADVFMGVQDEAGADVWDFALAALRGEADRALDSLRRAMPRGDEGVYLLSVLAGWFRLVIRIKSQRELGRSPPEIAAAWAQWSRQFQAVLPMVDRFGWPRLQEVVDRLFDMDRRIKTQSPNERALLESFVLWLCAAPPSAPPAGRV